MFNHGITPKIITMGIMLGILCVSGCSQSEAPPVEPASMPQISREALEAMREYRNTPIKRAQMTHSLGDERTQAIDEALKQ